MMAVIGSTARGNAAFRMSPRPLSSDRAAPKLRELSILMRARARYYDVSDPAVAVTEG